ncbi:MAG: hypothetical protein VX498_07835 [Myxococcota bacterium]|nr:hypothetical protein [Myxococcota bacterium]
MRSLLPLVVCAAIFLSTAALSRAPAAEARTTSLSPSALGLQVLVDGVPAKTLSHDGQLYIEALRGEEYSIRLTNRRDKRMAVALSVDGLNSIDARHTSAKGASKWVLGPHESLTISGWQVGSDSAREFVFTGEASSYGAWLGETRNLGIISAVAFLEKSRPVHRPRPTLRGRSLELEEQDGSPDGPREKSTRRSSSAEGSSRPGSANRSSEPPMARGPADSSLQSELDDERAATGSGERFSHSVEWVSLELEERPAASLNLRYGFRSELVELGVLPSLRPRDRRRTARGFSPDPGIACCR